MKKIMNVMLCLVAMASSAFANVHDLFFRKADDGKMVVALKHGTNTWIDKDGKSSFKFATDQIRVRVIDPPKASSLFGFKLVRPFLVLDGIYLGTEGRRTLSAFQEEANQFGLPDLLTELGYTPVLVQFAETVGQSLETNADHFTELLRFLNQNTSVKFENKLEDGFIVMGISQGGILGRYGSYQYDKNRSSSDAPIRLYASLDSPHQGAVMPKGLKYTIDFWAASGGAPAAENFKDLIEGPGADGLLLYQKQQKYSIKSNEDMYEVSTSNDRFLFGEYRKAAEYKGFPAILVAQGQMKGASNTKAHKYYELNRKAKKLGKVFGRAESYFATTEKASDVVAYNRMYQWIDDDFRRSHEGLTEMDDVQGSTYPFAKTLYESLRDGFIEAMPDKMSIDILGPVSVEFQSSWDKDTLYKASSTFIPTVSAMDLKCGDDLGIRKDCAFNETYKTVPFENPGDRSSANAIYAVDPTHPRYDEPISGRHIELPGSGGAQDTNVLRGMQVDIWRLLCEVARYDYDEKVGFRNSNLSGIFEPKASCMDLSKMPDVIKNMGVNRRKSFGYGRYDYNANATESDASVTFTVPAGWHKVAVFDNGESLPEGSVFETDVTVNNTKGSWMKAELLLTQNKSGTGQIQLQEVSIPTDGKSHRIYWQLPSTKGALSKYRWMRLVLNSDGADVEVSAPRLVIPAAVTQESAEPLSDGKLFFNKNYVFKPWTPDVKVELRALSGYEQRIHFSFLESGAYLDLGSLKSLEGYSQLQVTFIPGTCQDTKVYFDSYRRGGVKLGDLQSAAPFSRVTIPLASIVDSRLAIDGALSASRLVFQSARSGESCYIRDIELK